MENLCQPVREWFRDRFPDFTDPQKMAIPQIMQGNHLRSARQQVAAKL